MLSQGIPPSGSLGIGGGGGGGGGIAESGSAGVRNDSRTVGREGGRSAAIERCVITTAARSPANAARARTITTRTRSDFMHG